jgi:hypothetical protein
MKSKIFQTLGLALKEYKVEVHSVRPARRIGPDGQAVTEIVIEITQKRPGYFSDNSAEQDPQNPDFYFRGGCTLLVDPESRNVRYCVVKNINDEQRYERQKQFLTEVASRSLRATYFGTFGHDHVEPFALLHRSVEA